MLQLPGKLTRRALMAGSVAASLVKPTLVRAEPNPIVEIEVAPVRTIDEYTAYVQMACKNAPFYYYTCEFDAAWAVMKSFGVDTTLEEQLAVMPFDRRIEPYYVEDENGFTIYGGDIFSKYSGDFTSNLLCRTTGSGFRQVFEHFGFEARTVDDRGKIERSLQRGHPVWIKVPVDFEDWRPATWVTPEGKTKQVVLSNDHAMVVIGYNDEVVVLRDVLGPTDTNWERPYEFEVNWERFLQCWASQENDGLAVYPADV